MTPERESDATRSVAEDFLLNKKFLYPFNRGCSGGEHMALVTNLMYLIGIVCAVWVIYDVLAVQKNSPPLIEWVTKMLAEKFIQRYPDLALQDKRISRVGRIDAKRMLRRHAKLWQK